MRHALERLPDEELFRLLRQGDEQAFTTLYRRCQGPIYRFSLQMSGDAGVAEEVTQEVFMAVIRGSGQFDAGRGNLQAWLYGAARNQVRRHLEAGSRYVPIAEEDESEEVVVDEAASVLDSLTHREMIEAVRQGVLALPPHYREAVVLCDLQELSYEQAAAVLEVPVGTVRSRLNRGRSMLAGRLRGSVTC